MRTLYVYLHVFKTWPSGVMQADVFAQCEETNDPRFKFLFSCREDWLPKTGEELMRACAYYNQELPAQFDWYGWVPF